MKYQVSIKSFALSLFVSFTLVLTTNAFSKEKEIYVIAVGTNGSDFENNSGISASGDGITGNAIIYINGNPIMGYSAGGTLKQINQYIRNGKNSLQIKGASDKSLFVKIGIMQGREFKKVVTKKEFKPNDISKSAILPFFVNIDYVLPIFDKKNNIPKNVAAKSFYPLFQQLKKNLDNAKYDKVAEMFLSQRENWSIKAYGQDQKQFEAIKKQAIEFYRQNKLTYMPPEVNKIKILKGESILLVYSGVNEDSYFKSKTLGEFVMNGSKRTPAPAMRLAFIEGKWCIWE
jgi:hypothetical protein